MADYHRQSGHGPHRVGGGPAGLHRTQLVDETTADQRTQEPHCQKNTGVLCTA